MKFRVTIYENPFVYDIEAKNKVEAEVLAVNRHNGADWDEIRRVKVIKLKNKNG